MLTPFNSPIPDQTATILCSLPFSSKYGGSSLSKLLWYSKNTLSRSFMFSLRTTFGKRYSKILIHCGFLTIYQMKEGQQFKLNHHLKLELILENTIHIFEKILFPQKILCKVMCQWNHYLLGIFLPSFQWKYLREVSDSLQDF